MSAGSYRGTRTDLGAVVVFISGGGRELLDPRLDVREHSPTGFEWGYGGSGPAQLALALCIHALDGDVERARRIYQEFKWRCVAHLRSDEWWLDVETVREIIARIEAVLSPPAPEDRRFLESLEVEEP